MFFTDCTTPQDIKKEYRRLAKLHHPDLGGDTATMQKINDAYHKALEGQHGFTAKGTDGKDHTYYYNADIEQELVDKISEFLAANLAGVEAELIGVWLWVDGDTKPVKEELKAMGFKWHSKRQKWYFRRYTYRRKYSNASFDDLRLMYGSHKIRKEEEKQTRRQPVMVTA